MVRGSSLCGNGRYRTFFREIRGALVDAIRVYVRYEVPDENAETRRERYERFGDDIAPTPPKIVPIGGLHIWEWYFELSRSIRRVREGVCEPIPPTEFEAWQRLTKTIVYPWEYEIFRAMDGHYCDVMNEELRDYRDREKAAMEEAAKRKK